ncbi:MAG: GntR family transcriptional regulator [Candidatus Dormibacteraceae bacterium]
MILRVDPSSPIPPYEQIRGQVATMISIGTLPGGHRLPTIRQLAADLGLAGGTVARAYRELEQGGFILSRGQKGTSVAARPAATRQERERAMLEAASAFAALAVQAGVDPRQALDRALAGISATDRTRT